ncbi:MAG: hypothetical protein R2873_27860 [Caldilineaceae bacterium]
MFWGVLALLGPGRLRRLRTVILSGLAMTVLVLPLAPIALRQIPTYANPNLTVPTVGEYLRQNWVGFLGGYAWDAVTVGDWWLWAVLVVFVAGLGMAGTRQKAKGKAQKAKVDAAMPPISQLGTDSESATRNPQSALTPCPSPSSLPGSSAASSSTTSR